MRPYMKPLIVPGTLASIRAIGKYVLQAAAEAGLESRAAYRLRLAVDEIATNAVTMATRKLAMKAIC